MITCKVDQSTHDSVEGLHKHLRKLKMKQEDYYVNYEAKKCLFTNKSIPFINRQKYLDTDFINSEAMKSWYYLNKEKAKEYSIELVKKRIKTKCLNFVPCEVELRSLNWFHAKYLTTLPGYEKLLKESKVIQRFNYGEIPIFKNTDLPVTIDTREQKPLHFSKSKSQKLEYGDYALQSNPTLAIERKSLEDLIGTLVNGYERFEREVRRAEEVGGYLIVLCEVNLEDSLNFNKNQLIRSHTKIDPSVVFHNIRELLQNYDCVQFAFSKNRSHMTQLIKKILNFGIEIKKYDIQYLIQEGAL